MREPRFAGSLFLLLFLLLACGVGFSQNSPQIAKQIPSVDRPPAAKSLTVSGKVSSDGRSLFTDLDSEWAVSNAEALKGHEGSLVTVKCYIDFAGNQIHVVSVRTSPTDVKYASRLGDSAFRR